MKKQLSHHIKLEGVQSKFKLKTKSQLANDFNMIGALLFMEYAWRQHDHWNSTENNKTPYITITDFWAVREESQEVWQACSPGRNLFCLLWPRTAWDLFFAGVQTARICENEAINCKMLIQQLISQCTSCCSSDSEFTHNPMDASDLNTV